MGRDGSVGGAELDGFGGVGATHEVKPIAEVELVVEHPCEGSGEESYTGEDEARAGEAGAAEESGSHGGPG
jgi:hypothetical protein